MKTEKEIRKIKFRCIKELQFGMLDSEKINIGQIYEVDEIVSKQNRANAIHYIKSYSLKVAKSHYVSFTDIEKESKRYGFYYLYDYFVDIIEERKRKILFIQNER